MTTTKTTTTKTTLCDDCDNCEDDTLEATIPREPAATKHRCGSWSFDWGLVAISAGLGAEMYDAVAS